MKIPTIFGLSLLFVATALIIMFHLYNQNKTQFITKDLSPQNIRITNITPTSFTVNWTSQTPTIGTLIFGSSSSLGNSQNDDRDPNPLHRKTHIITLNNLTPQTTYYFKIRSDILFFPQKPFTITTPKSFPQSANRPLTGTLGSSQATSDPVDILVFLQSKNTGDLSTFVDQNSNYIIPLSNLRSKDLQSTITLDDTHPLDASLLATDSTKNSFILLKLPQTQPLPTVILGQNLELNRPNSSAPNLLPSN